MMPVPKCTPPVPAPASGERAASLPPCGAPSSPAATPALTLPTDVLLNVLQRVDLPSRLAALCTCRQWRDACKEPTLWSSIQVPADKAFRLWDSEFAALVSRCRGSLSRLDVSGSGITGKSLIRLLEAQALAPRVELLRLDHCCNLKLCDVLAFVQAISASPSQQGSPFFRAAPIAPEGSYSPPSVCSTGSELEDFLAPRRVRAAEGPSGAGRPARALQLKDVVPQAPPPRCILRLNVDGCKQLGAWEVQELQKGVGELDVSICSCSRIGVLQRCKGSTTTPPLAAAAAAAAGPWGGEGGAPAAVPERRCPGLCAACAELFKGCGESVCGACWEHTGGVPQMRALQSRLRLWQVRREAMSLLRNNWTDFRYGVELRSVSGNA